MFNKERTLFVAQTRELPAKNSIVVNVTSRSELSWARGLSPFLLGPVDLYEGRHAKNMENAWQYSKVYPQFLSNGEVSKEYWAWAEKGWANKWGDRYPMGRGAIPAFSLWKGEKLGYVEAREKIYLPLYAKAVVKTEAFQKLKEMSLRESLTLVDFDVYSSGTQNLGKSLKNPARKFGHGFVLYGLLTGEIDHEGVFIGQTKLERVQQSLPFCTQQERG